MNFSHERPILNVFLGGEYRKGKAPLPLYC